MIKENVKKLLCEIPEGVSLVAAAKARTPSEVLQAIEGGVEIIGENYVQEAQRAHAIVGHRAKWHFIGHLQTNKVKKAVQIFDMIETVDTLKIASEIDTHCARIGKIMPVLIEVNSGNEESKSGVGPERAIELVKEVAGLSNIKVMGLMTIAPYFDDPEKSRRYFSSTRRISEEIKASKIQNVQMRYLSMGMSDSWRVAVEEGSNMVRIGTAIFGTRDYER
ncbi:MAG: YggS family pyridoxal phosphate-dependent enzyme [bacterium]